MNADKLELIDDLCEALDYFEAKKTGHLSRALAVSRDEKPQEEAMLEVPTTFATEEPVLSVAEPTSPLVQDSPLDLQAGVPLPYRMVRRAPVCLEALLSLPEPAEVRKAPLDRSEPSLFLAKTERLVHELVPDDEKARKILRDLLRRNRNNFNRAKIVALIKRGLSPQEVYTLYTIRQNCRDLFPEFCRSTVWGMVYAAGAQTTLSWEQAEELWRMGLYERGELFRFFSRLCTHLENDPRALKRCASALNVMSAALRYGLPPSPEPCRVEVRRRLRQAVQGEPTRGESVAHVGRPGTMGELLAGRYMVPKPHVWSHGFRPYQVSLMEETDGDLIEILYKLLRVESPISNTRLQALLSRFQGKYVNSCIDTLLSLELVVLAGSDFWIKRDLDYCLASGAGTPRLPSLLGPKVDLSQAALFDVGLGLHHLTTLLQGEALQDAARRLFSRWGHSAEFVTQPLIDTYLERFYRIYGRLSLRK